MEFNSYLDAELGTGHHEEARKLCVWLCDNLLSCSSTAIVDFGRESPAESSRNSVSSSLPNVS